MVKHGIRSMTGFAARRGAAEGYDWLWDIRSVNGKGLDLRLRLPDGVEGLEQAARARVSAGLGRGNVTLSLKLDRAAGEPPDPVRQFDQDANGRSGADIKAENDRHVSPDLCDLVHEALHPVTVDRLPRISADLEMGADDGTVCKAQDLVDVIEIDSGIGKHRGVRNGLLGVLQICHFHRFARRRA